ncbi:unnamed protein product, partial [marine sediment metagenome]
YYGDFENLSRSEIKNYTLWYKGRIKNVSGLLLAEIVKSIIELGYVPRNILLDGDNKSIVNQFKERFNFNSSKVITVGIGKDFDYNWNFENDPPQNLPKDFDLIISQAMFEHLLNPYKHLSDLTKRLQSGGVIIVHTLMPGFAYHRYPIDAFRFFPDWFEAASERLYLSITRKLQRDFNIFYVLKKRYGK